MKSWFVDRYYELMVKICCQLSSWSFFFNFFFSKLAYDLVLSNSSMELWVSCKNFVNDSCFGYRNSSSCTRMFCEKHYSLLAWRTLLRFESSFLDCCPMLCWKRFGVGTSLLTWHQYIDGEEILNPPSFSNLEDVIALRKLLVKKSMFVFKSGCCV